MSKTTLTLTLLPVPPDIHQRSSFSSGPVSPLTSRPVDNPGLEETGRTEKERERVEVKGERWRRKSQGDEEKIARCEVREREKEIEEKEEGF